MVRQRLLQHSIKDPEFLATVSKELEAEINRIRSLSEPAKDPNFRALANRITKQNWNKSMGIGSGDFKRRLENGEYPSMLSRHIENDSWMRTQLINKIRDKVYFESYREKLFKQS